MSPALSVVLPVRNAEGTVERAVRSCLDQTFDDFELLVVINGSSDGSENVLAGMAGRDERIRILHAPADRGVGGAMAAGVAESRAPLVARMDADDASLPERFEKQYRMLAGEADLDAVSCQVVLKNALGEGMQRYVDWVNGLTSPALVARERFVECPVIQPSLMLRKASIEAAGGYCPTGWAEDHDLFLRMLENGARFGKVTENLFHWYDHEDRLTRTHPAYAEEQVWRMKAHYLARLPQVGERGVAICGAGPIGKRLGRLLQEAGAAVHGYFEVNPRRVGEQINAVPVAGQDEFGKRWHGAVLLSAVGVDGGRERVRELAEEAGYQEGATFFAVC